VNTQKNDFGFDIGLGRYRDRIAIATNITPAPYS